MDNEEIKKQKIDYKPKLEYIADYYSDAGIEQQNVSINSNTNNKQPLDFDSIPSIEANIKFLDKAIKAIPTDLANAIKEIYEPVRDIYYDTLIDKIIDPNPQKPETIIVPNSNNEKEDSDNNTSRDPIYPIVLKPVRPGEAPDKEEDKKPNSNILSPIILLPIEKEDNGDNDPEIPGRIDDLPPIILLPAYKQDGTPDYGGDGGYGPGGDNEEEGLWDSPNWSVEYLFPDLNEALDKEFNYILTKLVKYYTSSLKDIVNNYFFNIIRLSSNESKENRDFINNNLEITSNDIVNHCKHLLDISVKDENMAALKTEFLGNSFGIRNSVTHIKSFYVANELRKRYTNINYSKGQSRSNSTSDQILKALHAQYELQFRSSFENLFRYLDSSLNVTRDIFGLHIQNALSKQTILKKGGRR